ncbi:MAG: lamin tail domain-containing protein, partial [bacterium]
MNEIYCVTTPLSGGREEPEFVEFRNVAAADLDIGGWTISDIGRTGSCARDSRWAFPAGTMIPAGGFVVVCRTALDPQNPGNPADDVGFKVAFPGFPPGMLLFETFDAQAELSRMDDPATPNMVLLDPTGEDDQLALLGGPITNGGQCESPNVPGRFIPFAELVALRDATARPIDAVTFQELGPCELEFCGAAGAGGAYRAGPPKFGHTLGRDAASSDHPDSWQDLLPSSNPTPGAANDPGDTVAPLLVVDPANAGLSASMIEVRWDEPVFDAVATDPTHWIVTNAATGDTVPVVQVLSDPEEPGRHHYVVTAGMAAGAEGRVEAAGIPDVAIGPGGAIVPGPNLAFRSALFSVPGEALAISRIQEFDDVGFSPFAGDTVLIAGFVTLGDIPAVGTGAPPPIDRLGIWVQEPGGSGVNVFAFFPDAPADYQAQFPDVREFGVRLNDLVQVRGVVTEFVSSSSGAGAVTEVAGIAEDP